MNQVYRQLARDAGLVALATHHTLSYLCLMDTAWIHGALDHAVRVCVSQIAS